MYKFKNKRGLTFIEILVTVMILAGAIGGTLMLLSASMFSSQYAWDTTVATSHAQHILEEMQLRESSLDIVYTNWDQWLKEDEMDLLPQEEIVVDIVDENSVPLDITVNVNWKRSKRKGTVALTTQMSK